MLGATAASDLHCHPRVPTRRSTRQPPPPPPPLHQPPPRPHSKGAAAPSGIGPAMALRARSHPARAPPQSSCGCAHQQTGGAAPSALCKPPPVAGRSSARPRCDMRARPRMPRRTVWAANLEMPQVSEHSGLEIAINVFRVRGKQLSGSPPRNTVRRPCMFDPVPCGGARVAMRQGQLHGRIETAASEH